VGGCVQNTSIEADRCVDPDNCGICHKLWFIYFKGTNASSVTNQTNQNAN